MRKIRYPIANIQPIAKISSLARLLSVREADLLNIIDNIESFHRPGKLLKRKMVTLDQHMMQSPN